MSEYGHHSDGHEEIHAYPLRIRDRFGELQGRDGRGCTGTIRQVSYPQAILHDVLSRYRMIKMDTKAKKILSFGGWSFSTDHDTSPIFASGVSDTNRELFAINVVQFLVDNKLDGLDFDWEYPGATDIEGAVPGSPSDGLNYLKFLKSVKSKLPSGKTVSIALPASYWYLKGFPVKLMSAVVDYFIYMTYDLHGQWDYGSKFSNPGCKTGNCLRSHVNKTETRTSLSMITKAGVPSKKIMVGVSSYGRSFKMVDSSCTGVMCKFTGTPKVSNAEKGMCTDTSGYISDAEMATLIEDDELDGSGSVKTWFDKDSDSNIMTWDGNWVAYMDESTKDKRIEWVKGLNFGGTTDWAVDLQGFQDPIHDEDDDDDDEIDKAVNVECDKEYASFSDLVADVDNVPGVCAAEYAISTMAGMLDNTLKSYDEIKKDYDGKFGYYAGYIDELVNPQLEVSTLPFRRSTFSALVLISSIHSSASNRTNTDFSELDVQLSTGRREQDWTW